MVRCQMAQGESAGAHTYNVNVPFLTWYSVRINCTNIVQSPMDSSSLMTIFAARIMTPTTPLTMMSDCPLLSMASVCCERTFASEYSCKALS